MLLNHCTTVARPCRDQHWTEKGERVTKIIMLKKITVRRGYKRISGRAGLGTLLALMTIVVIIFALLDNQRPDSKQGNIRKKPNYILITGDSANIRTMPNNTNGTIVTQARSGDIFKLTGRDGDWFSIRMFSASGSRYVHASLARITNSVPRETDEGTRRIAFQAFRQAGRRAMAEADRQTPATNQDTHYHNMYLNSVLDDRYKLEACRRFDNIQPVHYVRIASEGIRKGWMQ